MVLAVIAGILFAGLVSAVHLGRENESFSPQLVWNYEGKELNGTLKSVTEAMDTNSDGKADILVEMHNVSSQEYWIELLNGADGTLLDRTIFTDVGSSYNGDDVSMEPTFLGEVFEDSSGTPYKEYHWMAFANHSDNKHISIYAVSYPGLSNISYYGINIPSSITFGGFTGSVTYYDWIIHVISSDNKPYVLYLGYYYADVYSGYGISEIQMIVMNDTLNPIWEKSEKSLGASGYAPFGVDITSFNGEGFKGSGEDILFVNLTTSPGNTTLTAIDSLTGNEIWNVTVNGTMLFWDPLYILFPGITSQFDYDRDGKVDLSFQAVNIHTNETFVYFIRSDGTVLGYADLGIKKIGLYGIYTDNKTGVAHTLYETVDVNGDNYGEIFIVNNNTDLLCWDIEKNSTVWEIPLVNQSYSYMIFLSTNDINSDGKWDVYLVGSKDVLNKKVINFTAIDSATGNILWNYTYKDLVTGYSGTFAVRELTDINGDGFQDAVIVDGYYNDGNAVYVNVSALSLKEGSVIWKVKVSTGLNNEDYANWSASALIVGDVNGDGVSDVFVEIYYHLYLNSDDRDHYWCYLRVLSGVDGSLLWMGQVSDDRVATNLFAFKVLTVETGWNQFDYNDDAIENEVLIRTGYSVAIYAVIGVIPEFSTVLVVFAATSMVIVFIHIRKWRYKRWEDK